jgi:hypothetical protein
VSFVVKGLAFRITDFLIPFLIRGRVLPLPFRSRAISAIPAIIRGGLWLFRMTDFLMRVHPR